MSDVLQRAADAAFKLNAIVQLIGAIKDVSNELRHQRELGKPVRKRIIQLYANLAAVLAADKAQAELDEVAWEEFQKTGSQMELPLSD
jgi:hypothetical protein